MKDFEDDELELTSYSDIDDSEDVFEHINRHMKSEDDCFSSEDKEENSESAEDEIFTNETLLSKLRYEVVKQEYKRKEFRFKYKDDYINATPMIEINPNKFVFKIDNKMKGIILSDLELIY